MSPYPWVIVETRTNEAGSSVCSVWGPYTERLEARQVAERLTTEATGSGSEFTVIELEDKITLKQLNSRG